MKNQKPKYLFIGITALICIVLFGLGGYYLWKQNQPSPSPITTTAEKIDSWKTYTNNDYSFQIDYPSRFNFVENANLALGDKVAIFTSSNAHIAIRAIHDIDVYKNKKPEDVAKREIMDSGYKYSVIGVKTGNYSAAITTVENNLKDKYPIITIAHPSKNLFIELEINIPINDSKGESDKILSSFQFLDTNQPVTINSEVDHTKRQITLVQRLDSELRQAKYTSLIDTDLELKIPPSFSITTKRDSHPPMYLNLLAVTDKESDLFRQIWNCYNEYNEYNRVPSVNKSMNESFCKDLLSHYTQKQLDSWDQVRHLQHNFFVDKIQTSATPQEWVLDNVGYQGTKLRDQPKEVSRGVNHTINGFSYLAISVMCCGGYEMNYFTQYKDLQGNTILLIFGTNDVDGKITTESGKDPVNTGNIVLDKILATIKKK